MLVGWIDATGPAADIVQSGKVRRRMASMLANARQVAHTFLMRARSRSPVVLRKRHDEFVRQFRTWMPVGHFYSPYPDVAEVEARAATIFDLNASVPGVDLRDAEQVALFDALAELGDDLPFPSQPEPGFRYHFDNPSYAWADGIVMHAMLRHIQPARVIEVGSGHSSAMILDTVDRWLDRDDRKVQVRFIEPYPELLNGLLRDEDRDRVTIDAKPVQDVDLEVFKTLRSGDVLVIDSTHVAKAGSDVNHLFLQVLPSLADGVWIHIHDIFMPFEYPLDWIREGRAWHEAYLLRAFLMYNAAFEIRWFQHYMWTHHQPLLESRLPAMAKNPGGNIWLQKVSG